MIEKFACFSRQLYCLHSYPLQNRFVYLFCCSWLSALSGPQCDINMRAAQSGVLSPLLPLRCVDSTPPAGLKQPAGQREGLRVATNGLSQSSFPPCGLRSPLTQYLGPLPTACAAPRRINATVSASSLSVARANGLSEPGGAGALSWSECDGATG